MKKSDVTTTSGRVQFAGISEAETAPWSARGGTQEPTCTSCGREEAAGRGSGIDPSFDRADVAAGLVVMRRLSRVASRTGLVPLAPTRVAGSGPPPPRRQAPVVPRPGATQGRFVSRKTEPTVRSVAPRQPEELPLHVCGVTARSDVPGVAPSAWSGCPRPPPCQRRHVSSGTCQRLLSLPFGIDSGRPGSIVRP